MHTDELLVLLVKTPAVLLKRPNEDELAAQTVSLLDDSQEGNLMLLSSS